MPKTLNPKPPNKLVLHAKRGPHGFRPIEDLQRLELRGLSLLNGVL